jgi:hypothetical protein
VTVLWSTFGTFHQGSQAPDRTGAEAAPFREAEGGGSSEQAGRPVLQVGDGWGLGWPRGGEEGGAVHTGGACPSLGFLETDPWEGVH